jgi:hypothetical protein
MRARVVEARNRDRGLGRRVDLQRKSQGRQTREGGERRGRVVGWVLPGPAGINEEVRMTEVLGQSVVVDGVDIDERRARLRGLRVWAGLLGGGAVTAARLEGAGLA